MTITLTREEAQQVLVVLEYPDAFKATTHAQTAALVRTRLAQPEPEPVAWMHSLTGGGWQVVPEKKYPTDRPLYTAPPQREWQGLTTAETKALWNATKKPTEFADLLQAKLKEKNAANA